MTESIVMFRSVSPGQQWLKPRDCRMRGVIYNVLFVDDEFVRGWYQVDSGYVRSFNIPTINFVSNWKQI